MSYATRVMRDLDRWAAVGLVSFDDRDALETDLKNQKPRITVAAAAFTLGIILVGFAAITFVAANWSVIPRVARLVTLVSAFSAAYILAGWLIARGKPWFGQAAALGGVIIFGASINLVAQMYNISGDPPMVALVWTAAAIVSAFAFRSPMNFGAAILLAALWGGWRMVAIEGMEWTLPLLLVGLAVLARFKGWLGWASIPLLLIMIVWSVIVAGIHEERGGLVFGALIGGVVAVLCGILAQNDGMKLDRRVWRAATAAFIVAFTCLFLAHILEFIAYEPDFLGPSAFLIFAATTIAVSVLAVAAGVAYDVPHLVWVGYVAFAVEAVALYFKTVGTLLETSAFFLLAGLLIIVIAVGAAPLRRFLIKRAKEVPS
ncbi:MAG: DUF2157 domain-containing protein [Pseudomonadota bacterium]